MHDAPASSPVAPTYDPVLEAIQLAVVTTDRELRIRKINAAGERFFRVSGLSGVGRRLDTLREGSDRLAEYCRKAESESRGYTVREMAWGRGEDDQLLTDVWINRKLDAQRRPDGFVIVLEDRTWSRRVLESEVDDNQLMRLGSLASGIAHEVKNPLGGIRGAAQLLQKKIADDRESAELAALMIRETDRISALLDHLMTFTRPGKSYPMESINIHRILDEAAQILEAQDWKRPLRVDRKYDPSLPNIRGYYDGLKQCFLNLMKNGVESMRDSNEEPMLRLEIVTRYRIHGQPISSRGFSGSAVSVEIMDRGTGIAEESSRTLFTPFRTTKASGTGLGLSISQKIVHDHRGALRLANRPGGGAVANITLPLDENGSKD